MSATKFEVMTTDEADAAVARKLIMTTLAGVSNVRAAIHSTADEIDTNDMPLEQAEAEIRAAVLALDGIEKQLRAWYDAH